jgi:hypothetical protein
MEFGRHQPIFNGDGDVEMKLFSWVKKLFRRKKKKEKKVEGGGDPRIEFPPIKEWRPPYWGEVFIASVLTFFLGIASTAAWEWYAHKPIATIIQVPGQDALGFGYRRCPDVIEVQSKVASAGHQK